jgi:GxxExxY protein
VDRTSLDELSERVIGAVFEITNSPGPGFLEKVYETGFVAGIEPARDGHGIAGSFLVMYKGASVGDYLPDILVERSLRVELKCVDRFCDGHIAQCMNYLKASAITVCLLVNFQRARVEWKRVVLNF